MRDGTAAPGHAPFASHVGVRVSCSDAARVVRKRRQNVGTWKRSSLPPTLIKFWQRMRKRQLHTHVRLAAAASLNNTVDGFSELPLLADSVEEFFRRHPSR